MNDRIRELYQQAHSIRRYDGDPALDGNPPTVYWQGEVSAQRLVEFVVQDVVDILSTYRVKVTFYDGVEHNCQHPITVIQKHFGVK